MQKTTAQKIVGRYFYSLQKFNLSALFRDEFQSEQQNAVITNKFVKQLYRQTKK